MSAALCLLVGGLGCDPKKNEVASATAPASSNAIVSLSPAATDLLLAMGAMNQLTGVSTFDSDARIAALPRVGDYENVDWERITTLAPRRMVVQMSPQRLPPGFKERAAKLGVTLHLTHIDRLEDVTREIDELGSIAGRVDEAKALRQSIEWQFAAIATRIHGRSKVRTLLATSSETNGAAGRDTYLNDLLERAGGENVVAATGYVQLDREALLKLAPEVIVQLAPAPTAAERDAIHRRWASFQSLPAVSRNRVFVIDEPWALVPASHVADLTQKIATFLHPDLATK